MTEREIKVAVSDAQFVEVRSRLQMRGEPAVDRHFEVNLLLDDAQQRLRRSRRLLRLRRRGERVQCTFKGEPVVFDGVKERAEYEFDLAEGTELATAIALFSGLGYELTLRYEKYRETWHHEGQEVLLDETPIGFFVEVEGADPRRSARGLGLDPDVAEHLSYPELWAARRAADPQLPRDMVFTP